MMTVTECKYLWVYNLSASCAQLLAKAFTVYFPSVLMRLSCTHRITAYYFRNYLGLYDKLTAIKNNENIKFTDFIMINIYYAYIC